MLTGDKELTYYEYWLTKSSWEADRAIQLIVDYVKLTRGWQKSECYSDFESGIKNKLISEMSEEEALGIFENKALNPAGHDRFTGEYMEATLSIEHSRIKPKEYIGWVYSKGYQIPYEFKAFIGIVEAEKVYNSKELDRMDRQVCQGIARTIWYYESTMEIEKMIDHKAIQVFGSGRLHSRDVTLRRWLSEVDTRKNKTGPKKKT